MAESISWAPTPTFLYRNYLYEKIISNINITKKYLLVGVGTGYFIKKLEEYGFKGTAIDISKEAIKITKQNINSKKTDIRYGDILKYKTTKKFDLVFSFEVLEHINNDQLAIKKIYKLLKKGGLFIFSVPAHMAKWGEVDVIGGHYRRYERNEIINKLSSADLKIKSIWTYGFPILNLIQFFSKDGFFVKDKSGNTMTSKTKNSGIRLDYDPRLKLLITNKVIWYPLFKIMDLFIKTDLGFGYVIVATKSR